MTLAFRNRPPHSPRWRNANPLVLAGRGYLLVDDAIHRSVTKTADTIENKTGLSRGALAYGCVIGGTALGTGIAMFQDAVAAAPLVSAAGPMMSSAALSIHLATRDSGSDGVKAENVCAFMCRIYRLPIMGVALHGLLTNHFGAAITFSFISTALYLASSSTGTLDRFRSWAKETGRSAKEFFRPAPQPEPLKVKQ